MTARARALLEALALVAIVSTSLLFVLWHQRGDSATMDEPYHLFAGMEYAVDGTSWLNLEHPPLLKLLAGEAAARAGALSPSGGQVSPASPHPRFAGWLYRNRLSPQALVQAGRRPFPWLLPLLALAVWAAARAGGGPTAGLLAAGVVGLDPTFVAHAGVIHTDAGAALALTIAVALAAAASEDRPLLWPLAGVALGLALATKFTAILFVPVLPALPLLRAALEPPAEGRRRSLGRALPRAFLALALAFGVCVAIYSFALRAMPADLAARAAGEYLARRGASAETVSSAERLSRAWPALGHWAAGLGGVALFSEEGRGANYFRGEVSDDAFPLYFPAAFLLKSTPAFLLLTLLGLAVGGRRLLAFRPLAFLLPAALLFAAATRSHFNIGVRHILPVYPLLAIALSGVLAARLRRPAFASLAAALVLSTGVSTYLSEPDPMSYFNVLAGGREGGRRWLSDSNLDWGQNVARLGAELARRSVARETTVVAFGGVAANFYVPGCRALDPSRPLSPGLYAVSDFMATLGPPFLATNESPAAARQLEELLAALAARGRRVDRVAETFTLWELPPPR